jgi:HAD superfamily hydrolase (TIGR01662 family)
MLAAEGAEIDAFYFCTHLYGCDCRKPLTGMVDRAVADHNIELDGSVLFGDRDSDIALARAAGITAVLVNAPGAYSGPPPDYRAPSLAQGVDAFLRHVHA